MSRKSALNPFQIETSKSMGATFHSTPTAINWLDNIGFQIAFITTDAVGVFSVEVSMDYQVAPIGPTNTAGTWVPITLPFSPVAASASDNIYIDITQISAPWIRLTYTRTSGTGTLNAWVTGKAV